MEVTIDKVFDIIGEQTNYLFVLPENLFKDFPKIKLNKGTIGVNELLNMNIPKEDFDVTIEGNNIFIDKKKNDDKPQERSLSGIVSDEEGRAMKDVSVFKNGETKGTATDLNGLYTVMVTHSDTVLVFSSLGFKTQEIPINNQSSINVSLKEEFEELEQVEIVVGHYYKRPQRENPGNVYKIDAKTIEKQPISNPLAAMNGYIPGVNIVQNTGLPGSGFKIEIRGKNFINADTEPLYILDGVPYNFESSSFPLVSSILPGENRQSLINPFDIESIEVLKDADATAIYGSRGANGVILITTKRGSPGKTQIKVNVTTGVASVPHFMDLLNTEQYLEMRMEAITNDGFTLGTALPDIKAAMPDLFEWDQNRYTDWQKVLIGGTAYRNTGQMSFSGGNEQTQFLFSGSYQNETTVFPGDSKYEKASIHSNVSHQSLNKRFQISILTNYVLDDNHLPLDEFAGEAYKLPPNAPALYNDRGDLNWDGWTPILVDNPLGLLEGEYRAKNKNLLLNTVVSYRPIPKFGV
ncbi:hypothetical protein GCM10022397_05070 [Flavivirga jejuensis]